LVDEHQRNWDQLLIKIDVAYNSAPHSATLCCPFYVNHSLHPRTIPVGAVLSVNPALNDFLGRIHATTKTAHRSVQHAQDSMIKFANRSRREHLFSVNDLFLLSTTNFSLDTYSGARKPMPKYCGPFKIVIIIIYETMELDIPP
jgi:hypothetical protein